YDSTGEYMSWETVDPEVWVPDGYAIVRVDSRGKGRSPGYLEVRSHRERLDYARCIEWAGERPWSNGRVGLCGISYYAINQWQVATLQPDHLEAICVWEGASDRYRGGTYHGGIYSTFSENQYPDQADQLQHGVGKNGYRSPMTGDWVSGPETLRKEELDANRADLVQTLRTNTFATDDYWEPRIPDLSKIEVPLLSAGNWGGHGLHLRGNVEGFMRVSSEDKWLEIHGDTHFTHFYSDYGVELQKRFFGHFLKGEDTGWDEQPPVQLQIRHPDEAFHERHEDEWPLARTDWTRYYLHPEGTELSTAEQAETGSVTYNAFGDGVTFLTDPLEEATEITGPIAAKLFVSSETEDADLFVVVRVFDPEMKEVTFQGASDPNHPVALGWLRASRRKLDEELTEEWRPYHTHDEDQPLTPGAVYELDVEVWPTCIVLPPEYRIGVTIRGTDYECQSFGPEEESFHSWRHYSGVGPFKHNYGGDRPPEVYGRDVTIHTGPEYTSHVLLPIIPDGG
ncbi:MAG: CocE/NonD family hydrolase, partial [Halobacteriota archaeon]